METKSKNVPPILEVAWTAFGQLGNASSKRAKAYTNLRKAIATFGVLATLFAILSVKYPANFPAFGAVLLKLFLIASPILASALAAYVNKFFYSGDWLITRAGSEEILKEIYIYRTILQNSPTRRVWLEKKLSEIQRSVYRGMNGELIMDPYTGILPPPPRFNAADPNSDPGFHDLSGEEYFKYRLEDQLNWHVMRVNQRQNERIRLQLLIIGSGIVGALLAAFGGEFTLWVALAASFTATFIGWQELRSLDVVVRNYSKVIVELRIISDHWRNLEAGERTQSEFNKMVRSTEDILWSQNVEYIKAMQEALKESDLEKEAGLINRVIQEQADSDLRLKTAMEEATVEQTKRSMEESEESISEAFKEALGSLAEEASSELVQAELASMQATIQEALENIAERMGLSTSLKKIETEFEGVEIGSNTPMSVLNDLISRYPKTTDVKG
jgi:uncharacterized protein YqgV (UPF0045/DUF77 family)